MDNSKLSARLPQLISPYFGEGLVMIFAKLSPSRLALAGLSLVLVPTSPPTHPPTPTHPDRKSSETAGNSAKRLCKTCLVQPSLAFPSLT